MLWGMMEMLNAAVTNLSDAVALKVLLLAQQETFPLQPNAPSSHPLLEAYEVSKNIKI